MQKLLLLAGLAILLGSVAYLAQDGEPRFARRFAEYKLLHNKIYTPEEDAYRQMIYAMNVAKIEAHNADPTQTYTMGENQFTDLTQEEFIATYLTLRLPEDFQPSEYSDSAEPNDSADWRGTT